MVLKGDSWLNIIVKELNLTLSWVSLGVTGLSGMTTKETYFHISSYQPFENI